MQAIQASFPYLRVKPLKLSGRLSGWIASADTPACNRRSVDCEESLRVESIDGKVYSISLTKSFDQRQDRPTVLEARSALQNKYGALIELARTLAPSDSIFEVGFNVDGEASSEACVALSEPAPAGRWLYGFASKCDWVFSVEMARTSDGHVRNLVILLGDAQTAYQAFGGMQGSHKPALGAVVGRQRGHDLTVAQRLIR